MKSSLIKQHVSDDRAGMTLIEIMIYSSLLSVLVTTCVFFIQGIHVQDINLISEINEQQN